LVYAQLLLRHKLDFQSRQQLCKNSQSHIEMVLENYLTHGLERRAKI
jgi:hypothetical protein